MSSDLILPEGIGALIQPEGVDDAALDARSKRGYLPRLQVMGGNSELVKEGKIEKQGTWALIETKNDFTALTNSVECLVLARRLHAIRKGQKGMIHYYDHKSQDYQDAERDAEIRDSGCFHGPEFLVWVREKRAFASFHANSKTARPESNALVVVLKRWAREMEAYNAAKGDKPKVLAPMVLFKTQFIKSPSYSWWAPQFVPVTTPFSEMPKPEDIVEQSTKFCNPPKSAKEEVQDDEKVDARG